jgi:enamine deaminase RidA (YjgF/YER057c/UK114 family)
MLFTVTLKHDREFAVAATGEEARAILPEGWKRGPGFSWGMSAKSGTLVAIAGQLGAPQGSVTIERGAGFAKQFGQCLRNAVEIVQAAGGKAEDIVMLRAYVCDIQMFRSEGKLVGAEWRAVLGSHFPAMTMVQVSRLLEDDALIEVDGFAVIPER